MNLNEIMIELDRLKDEYIRELLREDEVDYIYVLYLQSEIEAMEKKIFLFEGSATPRAPR